jgi:hypothetical protein
MLDLGEKMVDPEDACLSKHCLNQSQCIISSRETHYQGFHSLFEILESLSQTNSFKALKQTIKMKKVEAEL